MWFLADSDVSLPIDYLVDGEFVIPTSVVGVLRAHDGTPLTNLPLTGEGTSEPAVIQALYNSTNTNTFENRYVTVTFIHGGATHTLHKAYRLAAFLPITASVEQVRAEIGLDAQELPDNDIDLIGSYFTLVDRYGAQITAALTAVGPTNLAVNKAITLQAALAITTSLELRTKITVRAEDAASSRSADIDFDKITDRLQKKFSPLVDQALGDTAVTLTIFSLSEPTDAITG